MSKQPVHCNTTTKDLLTAHLRWFIVAGVPAVDDAVAHFAPRQTHVSGVPVLSVRDARDRTLALRTYKFNCKIILTVNGTSIQNLDSYSIGGSWECAQASTALWTNFFFISCSFSENFGAPLRRSTLIISNITCFNGRPLTANALKLIHVILVTFSHWRHFSWTCFGCLLNACLKFLLLDNSLHFSLRAIFIMWHTFQDFIVDNVDELVVEDLEVVKAEGCAPMSLFRWYPQPRYKSLGIAADLNQRKYWVMGFTALNGCIHTFVIGPTIAITMQEMVHAIA